MEFKNYVLKNLLCQNGCTFSQRRLVMRKIQKYIVNHIEDICRVCARNSGEPKVDALLEEFLMTCEKICTINFHGEQWLQKSYRPMGPMISYNSM